jgi:prophage DNA circulation protein
MSYSERRLRASFRNVEFYTRLLETSVEKSIATETFINTNRLYTEDLGRKHEMHVIDAYLIGPDYDLAMKRLYEAILENGPAILVHPSLGKRRVVAKSIRVSDSNEEIGLARFSLSFIESGEDIFPKETEQPGAAASFAEANARATFRSIFTRAFSVANLGRDSIVTVRESIKSIVDSSRSIVTLAQQGYKESADLAVALGSLSSDIESIITAPAKVAEILESSVRLVRVSGIPVLTKLGLLGKLYQNSTREIQKLGEEDGPLSQLVSVQKFVAALACLDSSRVLSDYAVTASRAPETAEPFSENEWRDQLKILLNSMAAIQQSSSALQEYEALENLAAKLLSLSESPDVYALPNLFRYTAIRRMPFILAVFDMYGSIERASEVMRRNKLDYPVFIEAGTVLEYLR